MSESDVKQVKILFRLDRDEEGYPPVDWETVWAIPRGKEVFEIDSIPFYVRGISAGDLVSAGRMEDGELHYQALKKASANSTFRIFVTNINDVQRLRNKLIELGAEIEGSNLPRLMSVHLDASKQLTPLMMFLIEAEAAGLLDYEEAAVRHK